MIAKWPPQVVASVCGCQDNSRDILRNKRRGSETRDGNKGKEGILWTKASLRGDFVENE